MVVVLPLPLAPRKPQISPLPNCKVSPSTTLRAPKLFLKARTSMVKSVMARRLLDLALRPEVLAFHRLFIAEAPRFPGLAKLFVERNRHRPLGEVIRVLAVYADRGMIELGDPEPLAEQFFILVAGVPQRMALF